MKNIRVIAAGIAAAGFISCTVTTHGTSQAVAEGDFAGRNAPYYYHAEGIKAHTVKGDMQAGIACFGPSAACARLEGSKAFAKEVMDAAGVPGRRE